MIRKSESIKFLLAALDSLHASEGMSVVKDSVNPHFGNEFASQGAIDKAINPYLHNVGLVLTQFPCVMEDGQPGLASLLGHVSGEWMESDTPLVMAKNDPQGQGSGITYLRRYATCAILRINADKDDDAEKAIRPPQRPFVAGEVKEPKLVPDEVPADPNLASAKQIGYLKKLLDDNGIGDGAAGQQWMEQNVGPWPGSIHKLSKSQAGAAIDLLK